jgi:hypothetical protein
VITNTTTIMTMMAIRMVRMITIIRTTTATRMQAAKERVADQGGTPRAGIPIITRGI